MDGELLALVGKLPVLDVTWPPDQINQWFGAFEALRARIRRMDDGVVASAGNRSTEALIAEIDDLVSFAEGEGHTIVMTEHHADCLTALKQVAILLSSRAGK